MENKNNTKEKCDARLTKLIIKGMTTAPNLLGTGTSDVKFAGVKEKPLDLISDYHLGFLGDVMVLSSFSYFYMGCKNIRTSQETSGFLN